MVAANIEIYSAGARDGTDNRKVSCRFPAQHARRFEAVFNGRGRYDHSRELREIASDLGDSLTKLNDSIGVQIKSQPARNRDSAPVARSATLCCLSKQRFLETCRIRRRHTETHIGAQSTNIRDMTNKSFKFQSNQTNGQGARRDVNSACIFYRLGVTDCVCKAIVAGNRLCEHRRIGRGSAFEVFLGALVSVEVAQLEMQNGVTDYAEAEMARLNDAGVNGADCHFCDTLALNL